MVYEGSESGQRPVGPGRLKHKAVGSMQGPRTTNTPSFLPAVTRGVWKKEAIAFAPKRCPLGPEKALCKGRGKGLGYFCLDCESWQVG